MLILGFWWPVSAFSATVFCTNDVTTPASVPVYVALCAASLPVATQVKVDIDGRQVFTGPAILGQTSGSQVEYVAGPLMIPPGTHTLTASVGIATAADINWFATGSTPAIGTLPSCLDGHAVFPVGATEWISTKLAGAMTSNKDYLRLLAAGWSFVTGSAYRLRANYYNLQFRCGA